jgi:hypothetical protein
MCCNQIIETNDRHFEPTQFQSQINQVEGQNRNNLILIISKECFVAGLHLTVYGMASKGLWSNNLSRYTMFDARDNLRKPLKPLLAIPCVELNLR